MSTENLFKRVLQVGMVVENLDEAVRAQCRQNGMGPWRLYTVDRTNAWNMIVRDEPADFVLRFAVAKVNGVEWELIEPLDNNSIYREFLEKNGEGLHHVAFAVDDYNETVDEFKRGGAGILQSMTWQGVTITYLDTVPAMSFIAEIYRVPEGWKYPPPEAVYP